MLWRVSRLRCRLFGHRWSPSHGPFEVCTLKACRGRPDASRFAPAVAPGLAIRQLQHAVSCLQWSVVMLSLTIIALAVGLVLS